MFTWKSPLHGACLDQLKQKEISEIKTTLLWKDIASFSKYPYFYIDTKSVLLASFYAND